MNVINPLVFFDEHGIKTVISEDDLRRMVTNGTGFLTETERHLAELAVSLIDQIIAIGKALDQLTKEG